MLIYFFKRVFGLIPLFIGITFVSFLVIHLSPGSPVEAKAEFNPKMTLEAKEKLKILYGLDRPLHEQYWAWTRKIARFDLGNSFVDGEKVTAKIGKAIPVTLFLNLLTLFVILCAGVPLGVFGAVHEGSRTDRWLSFWTLAGFSIPTFWIALVLMSIFGVTLGLLPVSGLHSIHFDEMSALEKAVDLARHLVLPVFVASITGLAGISRYMRSSMITELKENYVRTARAKGLPEKKVLYRHALKNAALPIVTLLGLSVPGLLGGSVIFESIFSIPGMGRLFFNSVFTRDYPVIMGILVLGAFLTLLGNLLADMAYAIVDPRIQLK